VDDARRSGLAALYRGDVRPDALERLGVEHVAHRAALHRLGGQTEPLGVRAVDDRLIGSFVPVADHRRQGVDDVAQIGGPGRRRPDVWTLRRPARARRDGSRRRCARGNGSAQGARRTRLRIASRIRSPIRRSARPWLPVSIGRDAMPVVRLGGATARLVLGAGDACQVWLDTQRHVESALQ